MLSSIDAHRLKIQGRGWLRVLNGGWDQGFPDKIARVSPFGVLLPLRYIN
jgi:hypothetical protein